MPTAAVTHLKLSEHCAQRSLWIMGPAAKVSAGATNNGKRPAGADAAAVEAATIPASRRRKLDHDVPETVCPQQWQEPDSVMDVDDEMRRLIPWVRHALKEKLAELGVLGSGGVTPVSRPRRSKRKALQTQTMPDAFRILRRSGIPRLYQASQPASQPAS